MKNLLELTGMKVLSKTEQKKVNGGIESECFCFAATECDNGYDTCYQTYEDALGNLSYDCGSYGGYAVLYQACRN